MENQMIGRRGEKRFETLCSDAGVTCNQSIEDDYGWDKMIEYPPRILPFAAVDMQPAHVIAAVQVKTTETGSRSVSISLTNALRYAKSLLPQFIVLVVLEEGKQARYFARHVWAQLIAEWLKAGREAYAEGIKALHKRTVTVAFTADDERGEDVVAWIRREIEGIAVPYAATKKLLIDTVGFENGHGSIEITISTSDGNNLIDLQLGLLPHLDVQRLIYTSERFGIRAGRPEIDVSNVRLQLQPEGRPCSLLLEFATGDRVSIGATMYGAGTKQNEALRVASRVIDITFGPGDRNRVHAQLDGAERITLEEMCVFSHLLAAKPTDDIMVAIVVEGEAFDMGSISMNVQNHGADLSWITLGTNAMRAIVAECGQVPGSFSMDECDAAIGGLQILSGLMSDRVIRVDFIPEPTVDASFSGFLAYCSMAIGTQTFSAVAYRPVIEDKMAGRRRKVTFGLPKLLWGRIWPSGSVDGDAVRTAYQRALDRYPESMNIMAMGDLERIVNDNGGDRELVSDLPTWRTPPILPVRSGRRPGNKG